MALGSAPKAPSSVPLTIEHIATLAEVSRSTVSRVLNTHPSVRPTVRERVLRVIREHNYAPQAAARSLASARTDTIGLLIPRSAAFSLADTFIASMIQSLFEASAQQGYFVMLAMLTADLEASFYDRILRGRHFDGVIIFSSDIDDPILPLLIKDGRPLVLIGRHPFFQDISSVDVENREGAREAVNHLIGLGHRHIGMINGQLEMEAAQARRDGYKQALLEAGISIEPQLMVDGYFSEPLAYEATLKLLERTPRPTAIFAASDGMAVGALRAIAHLGLRAPDDVAVVGYDDGPLAAYASPPLSSVHQPITEMGAHAVRLLIEQIRGQARRATVRLPAHLVVRQSSAKGGSSEAHPQLEGQAVFNSST